MNNLIDLNGMWTLRQNGTENEWQGIVPGCVHMDLEKAGVIPPIDWRDNEEKSLWVGEEDWTYLRCFEISEEDILSDRLMLVCEGLDTLADVFINDQKVFHADNMYRTWRYDIKSFVQVGSNSIAVQFYSPLDTMVEKQAEKPLAAWNVYKSYYAGRGYVRKMACAFGWDWGPIAVTAGIWKDISIKPVVKTELNDVMISQTHEDESVFLDVSWNVDKPVEALVTLSFNDEIISQQGVSSSDTFVEISIDSPKRWWPAGLGEQPLYDLDVIILDSETVLDSCHKKIGLRKLELIREDDEVGQSFSFKVNGNPFFVKGANCIPANIYLPSITKDMSAVVINAAIDANMNMLRVWGGGVFESEDFYDLCDEKGVLIWQDFMFACGSYPADDGFCENIRLEAVDNVKRLRHRASLALFCGNNELEGAFMSRGPKKGIMSMEDYSKIFDELLSDVVGELCDIPYMPGSPYSPVGDRMNASSYESGDAHLWSVWFGNEPFEFQRTWTCRFMSEFGFQSFPEFKTIEAFTEPDDRNWTSYIMDYHQRSQMGNKTIFAYMLDWFRMPENFEKALTMSQISQGLCLQYAVEHLRRLQPHNAGVLYWQINDIWPAASWSTMDCFGRWKASHYIAKRFFAPELISIVDVFDDANLTDKQTPTAVAMQFNVSNQTFEEHEYTVEWRLVTASTGKLVASDEQKTTVLPQSNKEFKLVECQDYIDQYGSRDLMFFASLYKNGSVISENVNFFVKPKHIKLKHPKYTYDVAKLSDDEYAISINSDVPSLWTQVDLSGVDYSASDNFFHLDGSNSRTINVKIKDKPDNLDINEIIKISTIL
ncbi:MAG: hypothetical protein PF692_14615 [Kiritimatiellae bacterium]|jgi:beta-mannosidase|nr:hypothetical protein [Kiritimatiellia bacterium]